MKIPTLSPPEIDARPHRPLQPGAGTRLAVTPFGAVLSADDTQRGFAHPWRTLVSGKFAQLTRGLVDGFEPLIDGEPLGANPPPRLLLDEEVVNAQSESWLCLEVEAGPLLDAQGGALRDDAGEPRLRDSLDARSRVVIVQRRTAPEPVTTEAAIGRQALALLLWSGSRVARVHACCHFNLRYQRVPLGEGVFRHLFF